MLDYVCGFNVRFIGVLASCDRWNRPFQLNQQFVVFLYCLDVFCTDDVFTFIGL